MAVGRGAVFDSKLFDEFDPAGLIWSRLTLQLKQMTPARSPVHFVLSKGVTPATTWPPTLVLLPSRLRATGVLCDGGNGSPRYQTGLPDISGSSTPLPPGTDFARSNSGTGMLVFSLNADFAEQGEAHTVFRQTKSFDVLICPRILLSEVVGRECQNFKPLLVVVLV